MSKDWQILAFPFEKADRVAEIWKKKREREERDVYTLHELELCRG
jgi:hypothetical protein